MNIFTKNETDLFELCSLYESYGYKRYKMNKFENYDLYIEYRNFLTTENIITFNDLNGKLMALKPDITLSIAKNSKDNDTRKVYYNENVYRTSRNTHEYKEKMQVGVEYIGDVDLYSVAEVISLSIKSLNIISGNYIMDISHMGFITGLFDEANFDDIQKIKILSFMSKKDAHEMQKFCIDSNVSAEITDKIVQLLSIYGTFEATIEKAKTLVINNKMQTAIDEMESVYKVLKASGEEKNINIDFSIVNDMTYYNGIIFQGYVENIPCSILYGGRYDNLLQKMGKNNQAIGFAIYYDLLELYSKSEDEYDVDIQLVYGKDVNAEDLFCVINNYIAQGFSVSAQNKFNSRLKYKTLLEYKSGEVSKVENND